MATGSLPAAKRDVSGKSIDPCANAGAHFSGHGKVRIVEASSVDEGLYLLLPSEHEFLLVALVVDGCCSWLARSFGHEADMTQI